MCLFKYSNSETHNIIEHPNNCECDCKCIKQRAFFFLVLGHQHPLVVPLSLLVSLYYSPCGIAVIYKNMEFPNVLFGNPPGYFHEKTLPQNKTKKTKTKKKTTHCKTVILYVLYDFTGILPMTSTYKIRGSYLDL